jgi:hypothetical protein
VAFLCLQKNRESDHRRLLSFSSDFFSSSFMPHLGHLPGLFFTTSGCIGQVYSFFAAAVADAAGDDSVVCAKAVLLKKHSGRD